MKVDIITPEETIYSGEVNSITVPGVNGEFQMLNLHAPIVSVLVKGTLKIQNPSAEVTNKKLTKVDGDTFAININGGVIELNNNNLIILAD